MPSSSVEAPNALGQVLKDLRRERRWTQEELGRMAGYQAGAGVAISRLENGRLEPTPDRFRLLAAALGLSAAELERRVEAVRTGPKPAAVGSGETVEARITEVQRAIERRAQLATDLERFNDAQDRARDDFLMRLVDVASRVDGAPPPGQPKPVVDPTAGDDVETEAAYSIEFVRFGVAEALAATAAGGAAVAGAAIYPTFTARVAGAVARGAVPDGTSAATAGLLAPRFAGAPRRIGTSSASRSAAVTGALAGVAITGALSALGGWIVQQRNRKQQRELLAKVTEVEVEIAAHQPNVDALQSLLPEATELLDYVAVHAGHALDRWDAQIGPGPCDLPSLGQAAERRYDDFVEIAAAQLAAASIDLEVLMTAEGAELERATALAHETLSQSRATIRDRV